MAYVSNAELAESFDAFYKGARDRLLLQTFAVTGDLAVARSAVREAFVVAWHHWRKTSRLPDPESAVRRAAWRRAARRSSARPWPRKRNVADRSRAILGALADLTVVQRKALLLTQLAAVDMAEMAHEVGLPLEAAERELQLGAAQYARQLDLPTSAIAGSLHALAHDTLGVTWPRVTIIRRAGQARRRAHTVLGGATAVVALVAGGAVVLDPAGARPTLDREALPSASSPPPAGPAINRLPDASLLPLEAVRDSLPGGGWREARTDDNSSNNGLVLPCQTTRYADPRGTAAWVRLFRGGANAKAKRSVTQLAEASSTDRRAARTYRTTLRWFTTCPTPADDSAPPPRLQLVSTADVPGVGDDAAVVVLRSHLDSRTYVVGVARTGLFTTTTSLMTEVPAARANRDGVARLLATAVGRLCTLADGGACADDPAPRVTDRSPYPVPKTGAFLAEIDLPAINTDQGPWVGTRPRKVSGAPVDAGAIGCETVRLAGSFRKQAIQRNTARTFLFDSDSLPDRVGLTQTVGTLPAPAAAAFVKQFRQQVGACPDVDETAGTEVEQLTSSTTRTSAVSAWRLRTALPGDKAVEYDVAVLRRGTSVAVLVYVAAPRARIADGDFVALSQRALERLERLKSSSG